MQPERTRTLHFRRFLSLVRSILLPGEVGILQGGLVLSTYFSCICSLFGGELFFGVEGVYSWAGFWKCGARGRFEGGLCTVIHCICCGCA